MTVTLTWRPGWQASSGVLTDASPIFAGNLTDFVTAYGTASVAPAVTLVADLGASDTPAQILLTLACWRQSSVLIEESSDGVTWSGVSVSQWSVWTGSAWAEIDASDSMGAFAPATSLNVWTWASNDGTFLAACYSAAISTTTQYLRVSVADMPGVNSQVDVQFCNILGTDGNYRGLAELPAGGPYMVYVPPVTARIALDPSLSPSG